MSVPSKPVQQSIGTFVAFAAMWIALLVVHYFLVPVFAGWLGTADDFIPWSATALLLWTWTRREFGFRPLTSPGWRRYALALWLIAVALAIAGIDEGSIAGIPAVPAAIVYTFFPIPIALSVAVVLIVFAVRIKRGAHVT
jgi:hypothetical protein